MKRIRHWIRRNFGFSQREVNGFLWLTSLLVLLLAAPVLFRALYKPSLPYSTAADRQLLDSMVAQLEAKQPLKRRPLYSLSLGRRKTFNPNRLTEKEWEELGLPRFMARRIINYRQKVGDFTYKAELGKIYGLPDSVFQQLYPYIDLPVEKPPQYKRSRAGKNAATASGPKGKAERSGKRFVLVPFNINTADTTQLKQIRGIGSKLSARILAFRDKLGGFHSLAQLRDVYGVPPQVADSLQKYSYVAHAFAPQRLKLNSATAEELDRHPYIKPHVARAIVAYREQHGPYRQVEEVRQVKLVSPALYQKLLPYLTL